MKNLALFVFLIAAFYAAKAQNFVGYGVYDDFNSVGQMFFVKWWTDQVNPTDYAITRTGTVMEVAVNKGTAYSPFGLGFGDANRDGTAHLNTLIFLP